VLIVDAYPHRGTFYRRLGWNAQDATLLRRRVMSD